MPAGHMRTAKAQIRLRNAQSDLGFSCPHTESLYISDNIVIIDAYQIVSLV